MLPVITSVVKRWIARPALSPGFLAAFAVQICLYPSVPCGPFSELRAGALSLEGLVGRPDPFRRFSTRIGAVLCTNGICQPAFARPACRNGISRARCYEMTFGQFPLIRLLQRRLFASGGIARQKLTACFQDSFSGFFCRPENIVFSRGVLMRSISDLIKSIVGPVARQNPFMRGIFRSKQAFSPLESGETNPRQISRGVGEVGGNEGDVSVRGCGCDNVRIQRLVGR